MCVCLSFEDEIKSCIYNNFLWITQLSLKWSFVARVMSRKISEMATGNNKHMFNMRMRKERKLYDDEVATQRECEIQRTHNDDDEDDDSKEGQIENYLPSRMAVVSLQTAIS